MEKFENKGDSKSPAVTIRKRGSISFNASAVKQFSILKKRFAIFHFDNDARIIGIQLTTDKQDLSAFPITVEKGQTPHISCQSFLRDCGIPFKGGSKVYPATWDSNLEMILIKLN